MRRPSDWRSVTPGRAHALGRAGRDDSATPGRTLNYDPRAGAGREEAQRGARHKGPAAAAAAAAAAPAQFRRRPPARRARFDYYFVCVQQSFNWSLNGP